MATPIVRLDIASILFVRRDDTNAAKFGRFVCGSSKAIAMQLFSCDTMGRLDIDQGVKAKANKSMSEDSERSVSWFFEGQTWRGGSLWR